LYTQRKNLLDIYQVHAFRLGIFRDVFDRVVELKGFELTPVEGAPESWEFRIPETGQRGRLLNVGGYLSEDRVSLTTRGRAYMVTRQDFTLGLLFPGTPRRIRLNQTRFKLVPLQPKPPYPARWPQGMVTRVIRLRFRNVIILEESFLLQQIGLRGTL
jgi:hypothetical protein